MSIVGDDMNVCDVCRSFGSYVRLQVKDPQDCRGTLNILILNLNNDPPPSCKTENGVTINCEFSLSRLTQFTLPEQSDWCDNMPI